MMTTGQQRRASKQQTLCFLNLYISIYIAILTSLFLSTSIFSSPSLSLHLSLLINNSNIDKSKYNEAEEADISRYTSQESTAGRERREGRDLMQAHEHSGDFHSSMLAAAVQRALNTGANHY